MKLIIFSLVLAIFVLASISDDFVYGQSSNQNTLRISFENNLLPSYEIPLTSGQTFTLTQNHSWVQDETSRYNLVSYTLDDEIVKISRSARGDFTLSIPTDSSHSVVFSAVPQYALSVEGTNDFSYLPSSPTNDNWFDAGTDVSVNVQKTTEIENNKVRQEITGWSLDKSEFWEIENDGNTSFTTPPILMNEYHQVDFFTAYQYKLNVISDLGETSGSGWYEQGITVPIGVDAGSDGLVLNSLSGWEGADVEYDGNVAQVFIDGPVTVSAKVEKNYSLVVVVIVIPILIIGVIIGKKIKNRPTAVVEKPVEKVIERIIEKSVEKTPEKPEKKYEDKYDEKLDVFLYEQSMVKLDEMHSSKLVSEEKYSKIKEALEFVSRNVSKKSELDL
jgi:hypothetical protein